jgi:hypothetical protein
MLWQGVAVCVDVTGKQWITCYYIVLQLMSCGVLCFDLSTFNGLFRDGCWIYYMGGKTGLEGIIQIFGT